MTQLPGYQILVLAAAAMALAGCSSSPSLKTYVLGNPAPTVTGVWSQAGLPVVELRTVSVPDYLDSSDIMRTKGPNGMVASPTGQWGERLSVGIARALASALSAQLSNMVITTTSTEPSRRIFVDVESFEIGADGRCLIAARWRITARDRQITLASEQGTFSETATSIDDAADAAAMTRLIDQLAGQIASSMQRASARARE
jgi:uncharacterized lipoprotein YmbA